MNVILTDGSRIQIIGDYPAAPGVKIIFEPSRQRPGLSFRIPKWSRHTTATFEGRTLYPTAGEYLQLDHAGHAVQIDITFDFIPIVEYGADAYENKCCIYRGPVLFGADQALNPTADWENLPSVELSSLDLTAPDRRPDGRIVWKLANGLTLGDFYHLGVTGSTYRTWFSYSESPDNLLQKAKGTQEKYYE